MRVSPRLRLCAAPLLGGLAACGFEPLHLWPCALLGLAGLIALIAGAPRARHAALIGWLWGVGNFAVGLNWIATAFTYQAKMPAWLGWPAVLLLALYLALYPMLAGLIGWVFRARPLALVLGFAGGWIVSEWLRGWAFTGFAWNPLAMVTLGDFDHAGLACLAPWLGTYGLSGLVALLAGGWWRAAARRRVDWRGALLLMVPALALAGPGVVPRPAAAPGRIAYTLVQPNIGQDHLDDPELIEAHYQTTAALTRNPRPTARLVLWPESGTQELLRGGYPGWAYVDTTFAADPRLARLRLARTIGPGAMLLTGAVDLVPARTGGRILAGRNVVTALDDRGRIVGSYAKAHLVPYGEYLPMRGWLTPLGLARLVPGDIDFWPGPGPETLDLGRADKGGFGKVGVAICYEIVFSGQVIDRAHRPDYIFNPSTDGWFGAWGPPQHLAQARLRAIEEGLPVLRATTDGISAVIDADGIVRDFVPRGVAARRDGLIPPPHPPTLFARVGTILPLGEAMMLLGAAWLVSRRRSR